MPTLHLLGRLVLLVGFASVLLADEKPTRPQWQRLLTGEDLRLAQIMENHFTHHWQNANFKDALRAAQDVHGLRARIQGPDHWETIDARWRAEAGNRTTASRPHREDGFG